MNSLGHIGRWPVLALHSVAVSLLCATLSAQSSGHPFPNLVGRAVSYLRLSWPEGVCNSRDWAHGRIAYDDPPDLRPTHQPALGSPISVRVHTPRVSESCAGRTYFGMLLIAFHAGNVMPPGHGILPDGSLRLGQGLDCSISVVPQWIIHFAPDYGGSDTVFVLLPSIPRDPAVVGVELYLQGAFVADFSCRETSPWGPPAPLPDYALMTTDVMRLEIQQ